jgi:hypothetical protein
MPYCSLQRIVSAHRAHFWASEENTHPFRMSGIGGGGMAEFFARSQAFRSSLYVADQISGIG